MLVYFIYLSNKKKQNQNRVLSIQTKKDGLYTRKKKKLNHQTDLLYHLRGCSAASV